MWPITTASHCRKAKEGSATLPGHKATTEWTTAGGVRHACTTQEGWTRCQTAAQGLHVHRRLMVYPGQQEQDQRDPNFTLQVPSTDLPHPRPHGPVKVAAPPRPHPQAWSLLGNSPWPHPEWLLQSRLPLETWTLQALTSWAGSVSGVTWRRALVRQERKQTQSRVGRVRSWAGVKQVMVAQDGQNVGDDAKEITYAGPGFLVGSRLLSSSAFLQGLLSFTLICLECKF